MGVVVDNDGVSRDMDYSMTESQFQDMYYRRASFQRHQCVRDIYFEDGLTIGQREKLLFLGLIETAYIRRLS